MSAVAKKRLDILLVEAGLAESREKAQAVIMSGVVSVDGVMRDKPGEKFHATAEISIQGASMPYVSRGGFKLEAALDQFELIVEGKIALDVGASTGGFTDCLLQRGATLVYAVDVGYGQMHDRLRNDPRVKLIERQNARYLTRQHVAQQPDIVTVDVSFISVKKVLESIRRVCHPRTEYLILVKPQFEAGRQFVGRGVVRSSQVHATVLTDMCAWLVEHSMQPENMTFSPIKGPRGNIEFWILAREHAAEACSDAAVRRMIESVVSDAHLTLDRKR